MEKTKSVFQPMSILSGKKQTKLLNVEAELPTKDKRERKEEEGQERYFTVVCTNRAKYH